MSLVTRRYHCFPTYVDNAANRSLKVRIEKELFCMRVKIKILSFQGKKKKSRKKIQKSQIRYCLGKGPKEKKTVKEQREV